MSLTQRKKDILKYLIENFIENAEPVSSQSIAESSNLGISSATIRKEMNELEELGYLTHPHTSAGRIPTDLGYRYYVDNIVFGDERFKVNKQNQLVSIEIPSNKEMDLELILQSAVNILFKFTNYVSMIITPEIQKSKFKHMELIELTDNNYIFILITDSGRVFKERFNVEGDYSSLDMQRVKNILNFHLKDIYIHKISETNVLKLIENDSSLFFIIKKIIQLIKNFEVNESYYNRIFMKGALSILKDPNFIDVNNLKSLFGILEDESLLKKILQNFSESEDINVKIGKEIYGTYTDNFSLVASNYKLSENSKGSIGILGPKRMDYFRVISVLDTFRENLTKALHFNT